MKKEISSGTIARTIVLGLALVNQILVNSGVEVLPIENAQVETIIATTFTVATSLVAWWKNNSFTQKAILADELLKTK